MSPADETIVVPNRFNGPLESGNGGYASGVLAGHLEGAVEVNLRSPVPLDTRLRLERDGEASLRLLHGDTLIAEARSLPCLDIEPPASVSPEQARRASERYRGTDDGLFSRCFICGRGREDSFEVFAGQVDGRDLVATPWTPPAWAAGPEGEARPELSWAVLDCPTYFACHLEGELTTSMLVRQRAELRGPVMAGTEHVVVAWPIAIDGRKRLAGCAILSPDGEALAIAEALLIEPRLA